MKCLECGEWNTNFNTSDGSSTATHKLKEVNVRMVAFVRSIGRGHSALQNFSMYLNSSQPMTRKTYSRTLHRIHSASKDIAMESMNAAAKEVRELKTSGMVNDTPTESNAADCTVSLDGSWQHRGHASHHGVVTAISVDTQKCVDAEVLTNICKWCQHWEAKKESVGYEKWKLTHICKINHTGSAEAVGAVRIFSWSEQMRKLRYKQYLGEGDSASFKKVLETKPYGNLEVEKLECVGHIQKRCGTRLRKLKNENKRLKLDDRKGLGGIGRLTDKKIDTLQNYYGFAIRQNPGNLDKMLCDIMAVLPHVGSTDVNPNHGGCPNDSWCKYKLNPEKYRHGLPQAVMDFIQPVFTDLANEDLLRKCLHGKTQNSNETLNKLVWQRCSKEVYVERETIEEAVFSAISF
uniref:Mutator-like transposase domain-containing protein n=1 Tax=Arion vulgaris TaxID=1028688 RepID=A0A0B7BM11_9EUPU